MGLRQNLADQFSYVPLKINCLCNGNRISSATGFVYQYENEWFLVSNWHVFSGRNPNDSNTLNGRPGTPDALEVLFHVPGRPGTAWNAVIISLYDSQNVSLWMQLTGSPKIRQLPT